ncbi:putative TIM-barrel fold metal-dependent hydrolase [Conyzicola lurida]|uniref:Putative TIM-barrel fold metal-dependent hydrolase n=1 Tax=Conyzicola lurida TaxID=1172621 RepID=A0A841AJW0_9MICO|nr:amidohydrolase family protein [Conyzicola lurida]MBB5841963.1 putative TIM-barrel fold metal-dependent hydrolase [Conyzicola lurida]
MTTLSDAIEALPLVDHHVHSILPSSISETEFIDAITEADHAFSRETAFDTQLGFALRRHCAPILGLPAFATGEEYLAKRAELGYEETTRRLLRASGISDYIIDGGYLPEQLLPVDEFMGLADATPHTIVRLETVAEAAMDGATSYADFLERLAASLAEKAPTAIGYKSVAAYRCGLDLAPERPTADELATAASDWFDLVQSSGSIRLVDKVIVRHLIWWALADEKSVLQIHAGFGGTNLMMETASPVLMQKLVAATQHTGGRIVFLHCYPYAREAGFLAHLYPHVYMDVGEALNYVGANAVGLVRESLDLAPFNKVLFSSDAWGLPELVYLGAKLWRDATSVVLGEYVERDGWPESEALRVATLTASGNAAVLYGRSF